LKKLLLYILLIASTLTYSQSDKAFSLSITVEESIPDTVLIPQLEELTIFTKSQDFQISKKLLELKHLKSLSILVENDAYVLPEWIGELQHLEELYIKWSLQEVPVSLFKIKGLKALSLIGEFKSIPEEIENLYQLEYLNISSKGIWNLPKQVFSIETLGFLSLINCSLESVPFEIQQLDKMEYLDLGNNIIHTLPPLKDCQSLVEVNLHENKITPYQLDLLKRENSKIIFKYDYRFQKFNHIRSYEEIRSNKDNSCTTVKIAMKNEKIEILDLSHCDNIEKQLQLLDKKSARLQHVKVLLLNGNKLSNIPESLSKLKGINEIYLQGNNLGVLPNCLHDMENLRVLNISDNPFTGFGAYDLHMHHLKKLVVDQGVMNTTIIDQFYKYIPNLKIVMK